MKIGVIGIGGVGGFYGGRLAYTYGASSEHEVYFIARGEHLERIREKGLTLRTKDESFIASPRGATDSPAELGELDLIILCIKEYALDAAVRSVIDTLHNKTIIIPLLNGVDNARRISDILPRGIILNGAAFISSYIVEPGIVEQVGGSCKLVFGPGDGNTKPFVHIERLFLDAGINAVLSDTIEVDVWTKYIFIGPSATMTAMTGKTLGEIVENRNERNMLEEMMREVEAIARKQGVSVPKDIVKTSLDTAGSFPYETKTSFQLDVEKGKKAEIETFTGYIVKAGKKLSIDTPIYDRSYKELLRKQSFITTDEG